MHQSWAITGKWWDWDTKERLFPLCLYARDFCLFHRKRQFVLQKFLIVLNINKLTPFPTSCCLYQLDFVPRIKTILGILNRKTFNPQILQNNWKGQISEHQAIAEPARLGIRKPGWRGCLESAIALCIQEDIEWSKETRVSS